MRLTVNPLAHRRAYSDHEAKIISRADAERARLEISRWPGYTPTPLLDLRTTAHELAIGQLLYKDESGRLGQGSFKTLGGAYAAQIRLRNHPDPQSTTL